MRQVTDETNGVRECVVASIWSGSPACGGVQGREQGILYQHLGAGNRVEQAGLARVGVADDGHVGHLVGAPAASLGVANRTHRGDFAPQFGEPAVNAPPVGLQLGLTRSTGADSTTGSTASTTGLPGQRLTPAAQPR